MTCGLGGNPEETVYNGQFGGMYHMSGERFSVYNLHVSSVLNGNELIGSPLYIHNFLPNNSQETTE